MTRPRPILFLNHDMSSGGAERALLNLLSRLDRSRFAPSLWVRKRSGGLLAKYEALDIPLRETPHLISDGPRRRLVGKALLCSPGLRRFDIVHSFCSNAWWTESWAAHLARRPMYIIRKSDHYLHGYGRSWETRHRLARRIVCVTQSIFDRFYQGNELEKKALVIHNGVDTDRYRPLAADPSLRRKLNVPAEAGLFANVANLSPYKGQLQLLIVLAIAKARGMPLYVAFAGRDLAGGEIQQMAVEFGVADRAKFLDTVEDIPSLLAGCDGMVLLSPREGCSNAVLEAMSCGVPVVVSTSGTEELIQDGQTGFVIPKGELEHCAHRLHQLATDETLRLRMGEAARRRAISSHALDVMARQYEELYAELLGASRAVV